MERRSKQKERERERESVEVSEKHGVGVSRKIKQFAGPKRKLEKSVWWGDSSEEGRSSRSRDLSSNPQASGRERQGDATQQSQAPDLSAATKTMKIPHQGCARSLSHPLKILQNAAQEVTLTINKPRSRTLTRNLTSCLAKPTFKTWRIAVWATRKLMSSSLSKTTFKLSEWRF